MSRSSMSGIFLSLEGVDGAGKSTQVRMLANWLQTQGHAVVVCREPGGTAIGEEVRRLLLHAGSKMSLSCEMLLYMASRAQLVQEIIEPALAEGNVVLCDRFQLSTLVYQGHAGGLDVEILREVGRIATGGLLPDWTGVLDLDPEKAGDRRTSPADRIEGRELAFHQKVRAGYLQEARRDPERISIIDADHEPQDVHRGVVKEVSRVLSGAGRA